MQALARYVSRARRAGGEAGGRMFMKMMSRILAVAALFMAVNAFAAGFEGKYTFESRMKEGKPDLTGWQGTMTITGETMRRDFTPPAGSKDPVKFYVSKVTKNANDTYTCEFTDAYKPEYKGMKNDNTFNLDKSTGKFVMKSTDGKFVEVWKLGAAK